MKVKYNYSIYTIIRVCKIFICKNRKNLEKISFSKYIKQHNIYIIKNIEHQSKKKKNLNIEQQINIEWFLKDHK